MYLQTLTEVSKGSLSIASMKLVIIFDAGMQIATNSLLCINAGFITFSSRKRVVHLVKRKKKADLHYPWHFIAISHILRCLPWKVTTESPSYLLSHPISGTKTAEIFIFMLHFHGVPLLLHPLKMG
jgi:hypothetical protein